jgi:chromosome segregation ATPase
MFFCSQYELELNATRQQLLSLQSLLDQRNAQLDTEREVNEQLNAELKRLLHEASDVRRLQEAGAEISRLKQQYVLFFVRLLTSVLENGA